MPIPDAITTQATAAADKAEGWSALEIKPGASDEQKAERQRINRMIFATFNTGPGVEFIEWLRERTIMQPSFDPRYGAAAANQGFFREGENNIYRTILKAIHDAKEGV